MPAPSAPLEETGSVQSACKAYLQALKITFCDDIVRVFSWLPALCLEAKGFSSPEELARKLQRCQAKGSRSLAPKPEPDIPGAVDAWYCDAAYMSHVIRTMQCTRKACKDTTNLQCQLPGLTSRMLEPPALQPRQCCCSPPSQWGCSPDWKLTLVPNHPISLQCPTAEYPYTAQVQSIPAVLNH